MFLSAVTVAELRYGAIVAEWGAPRLERIEAAIAATTVVPVSDAFLTTIAELRAACRRIRHPLAQHVHSNDLWIAATARHIDAALVTADSVFVGVPSLVIVP